MCVYLDLAILLNFLVDLLLLLGTNRLSGFPAQLPRLIPAAGLGACYGGLCLRFRFLGAPFWRLAVLALMGMGAFGLNRSAWRRTAVFVILSTALGGMAVLLDRGGFGVLITAAAGIWLLCRVAFEGSPGTREYIPLTLSYGSRTLQLTALKDTGNTLRDPVTGEPVLVISSDCARKLTGLTEDQLHHPAQALGAIPGLRLIPYCSVGRGSGLMLALRFRDVRLGKESKDALVAFAPEGLGKAAMVQALTGGI